MKLEIKSLRSFIGSKDFDVSRSFYRDLGFEETIISDVLSLFQTGEFAFYLSPSDVEDWINNIELFIVVGDVRQCFEQIKELELKKKYPEIRIVPVKEKPWGEACYILDPSGSHCVLHNSIEYNYSFLPVVRMIFKIRITTRNPPDAKPRQ